MSDCRPRTPGGSLVAVESQEHATAVIRSLRSVISSQKRYQTGDQPINRAAFDGMVSRAKVETEQQRDLAARAERALITGVSSQPAATTSKQNRLHKHENRTSKQPSAAEVMSKGGSDLSSDDESTARPQPAVVKGADVTSCQDDPSVYGLPPRSSGAISCKTVAVPRKQPIAPTARSGPVRSACTDDPSIYGVPSSRRPVDVAPSISKTIVPRRPVAAEDSLDFSSDDDGDDDKYTKYMDAPPVLPEDDIMCGSARGRAGWDDEDAGPAQSSKPPAQSSQLKAPVTTKQSSKAPRPVPTSTATRISGGPARSMSAGSNGLSSPSKTTQTKAARLKKVASGDFSDDERDDDEVAIEHDLFGGQGDMGVSLTYSDAVKKSTAGKVESAVPRVKTTQAAPSSNNGATNGGAALARQLPVPVGRSNGVDADSGKRAIIKPGQGIKVVRGGKKTTLR